VPTTPRSVGPIPPRRPLSRPRVAILVLLLVVGTGLIGLAAGSLLATEEIRVEVAEGTAQRLAAGEAVELLPRTLEVQVGDRLEIVNLDTVPHEVGPYVVAPGQTLRQTFTTPGVLEGACTLHPSGSIRIVVR
jgi:plastocyanin